MRGIIYFSVCACICVRVCGRECLCVCVCASVCIACSVKCSSAPSQQRQTCAELTSAHIISVRGLGRREAGGVRDGRGQCQGVVAVQLRQPRRDAEPAATAQRCLHASLDPACGLHHCGATTLRPAAGGGEGQSGQAVACRRGFWWMQAGG